MSDYHLHIHPHRDVAGAPPPGEFPAEYIDRYVEIALERGAEEVAFVEQDEIMARELDMSLDRYVDAILAAKGRGLPVKLGLEVDYEPGTAQKVIDLIKPYPWDFLVGSVHWIGAWWFLRPAGPAEYERRGVRRAFEEYFELATALAETGMADSLGHVDVIKVAGMLPGGDLRSMWDPVVDATVRSGMAVEISSQGLLRPIKEIYPAPAFLDLFHAAGVPITLGSNAHTPEESAFGYTEIVAEARRAGYSDYLRFDSRRRLPTSLPDLS